VTDLSVLYEHPRWFEPLFAALERQGVATRRIAVEGHVFDPAERTVPSPVVFNRLAMSSVARADEHAIFYTQALLAHWEAAGARVVNGAHALALDASKARQLSLLAALGLATPRTRVIHRRRDALEAARDLRFPLLVKANIGGAGGGIARYDTVEELAEAAATGATPTGVDGVALVQEYRPVRDGRIIRCETLEGRFLYALEVLNAGASFDLCPADACAVDRTAGGAPAVTMRAFQPPPHAVAAVESIARAAGLDVGGVEYFVDDEDGTMRFYDVNALSNFVADPLAVLGYDPHDQLAAFLARLVRDAQRKVA
jgi:glutathione synthase/RimK-type ligase-like ATP-grasp enzyme